MVIPLAKVRGYSTFQGYVIDENEDGINGAAVILTDCYDTIIGYTSTSSSGYYYFSVTFNGNSPYKLSAAKVRYPSESITVSGSTTHTFQLEFLPEKIAVLFWASDACCQAVIDRYTDTLEVEGYTTIYEFKDAGSISSICQSVDNYETDQDTIFVYIVGHGQYKWGHSRTWFKSGGDYTRSDIFKGYMDAWEAPRKCILVDSCESYGWAEDYDESPFLAMSTSDKSHNSGGWEDPFPLEGVFSYYFFLAIEDYDKNAEDAFVWAYNETLGWIDWDPNPQIRDNSVYEWFS